MGSLPHIKTVPHFVSSRFEKSIHHDTRFSETGLHEMAVEKAEKPSSMGRGFYMGLSIKLHLGQAQVNLSPSMMSKWKNMMEAVTKKDGDAATGNYL